MSKSRQLERLLVIDNLIRGVERQTTDTLAQRCEVSTRTLSADLDFLRDRFHAPLRYSKKEGWRYTDATWRLPSLPLAQGELFALTLGARMLQSYSGSVYQGVLQSAIDRLAERLPESIQVDLQQLAEERVHFRAGGEIRLDPDVWTRLLDANARSRRVWIRYFSPKKQTPTERYVDPYALDIYRASNPYLWGYCHLREEIRSFRVDRIRELKVLEETFERDPTFNLKEKLRDSFQYEVGGEPVDVVIDFDAETAPYITERTWHGTQTIEERPDGSIALRFTAAGLNDIKRWVLGYGKGAIARHPPELVAMLREETNAMSRQNESGKFER
ncbi:WYL domain-containing protein [Lyngbya sp. CCY1209]|uniref:helix-turn-helix transcriptional regulator n=1 Tax=Lyngbya sp. CCY1209 TaxID=2886103 RepID=UPI002D1FF684|nr:WYL domain-containing protein [Lyngbya sp. CCY1209]MEB3884072.1 WYL domain-containing protein [Lyngbya sp. CCY1209]